MTNFSELAKDIRIKQGLSQINFARELGVPCRSYIRFEKGQSKSLKIFEMILDKYNLKVEVK